MENVAFVAMIVSLFSVSIGAIIGIYIGSNWKVDDLLHNVEWEMPSMLRGECFWLIPHAKYMELQGFDRDEKKCL